MEKCGYSKYIGEAVKSIFMISKVVITYDKIEKTQVVSPLILHLVYIQIYIC